MWAAVSACAVLAAAGLATFWWASTIKRAPTAQEAHAITVTIRDDRCEPNDMAVPAGRTTFIIHNASQRVLEWEILDGVMVVEERENIAPGFSQTLTAKLRPGRFDITCGLLSNPRGTLTVTRSAATDAEAARPSLIAYVGPLAEYRVTLLTQARALQKSLAALDDAITTGDMTLARAAYLQAHLAYARIEPMSDLFADLNAKLNVRPEYLEQREHDPTFVGLYRMEHALYRETSLDQGQPLVGGLQSDAEALRDRLRTLRIEPAQLAAGAARLMQRSADGFATDTQSLPPAVLANTLQGRLDGVTQIARLLTPLLTDAHAAVQVRIDEAMSVAYARLDAYRRTPDDRAQQALVVALIDGAGALSQVNAQLGLE